ncbi:MAG: hypothetical protein A2X05_07815 [Bacteroidetes bacterium GWE2_41_25]|nr:MAG: hypothetical protein A2X03_02330 [Bacteroidetes bacterium GWA2_40_15]OFX94801.1 MAG: hypothetical protein A2X06_17030 [Bacteroidetes bacterium GWC2_40_22]OFY00454.1 MAG: hypothetical protein A2X05_07815 [Bacteroidetes bacterium GWE2_41_25]OFY60907.1 MAG: hypothetical protein A2X04_09430 [Bacteroidetes bacterium GWF2_41_9]HBH84281.1 hypothetical protein [Bacteroidales bacterium]
MIKALFFSLWFIFHPVHVTLTSIDYIADSNSLNVFVKMYFDDFLLDMNMLMNDTSGKDISTEDQKSRDIIENYLNSKLLLRVNKKLITGKLNDFVIVDNEVKLNFGYSEVRKPEIISVKNLIMTELYPDQSNLIIIKINEFEEGIKLTSDNTEQILKIK